MNILTVVPWDQEFGGVASVAGNLGTYLAGKKNKVFFLHPGPQNILSKGTTKWGFVGYTLRLRVPFIKGHSARSLIAFLLFFPPTLIQLMYVLWIHKIKIINVHYPLEDFFYFAICRKLLKIKLITSIHGADFFPSGKQQEHYPLGIRFLLASSDCIVAPSKAFLQDFMTLFPNHKNKGSFIHNGVSIDEINDSSYNNEIIDDKKYLLCIAAHNQKKGIDILINAFSQLKARNSSIQLLLVGDGPLRHEHEELVKALGLQDWIVFLGERGRKDVIQLLHGCELFVLPSRSEPFGIVITEAMACRKPVVATRVGGIPEIIENGNSGILVEPDNPVSLCEAINSVLEDEDLRTRLAANGYTRLCTNFLWEHAGARYETLFARLLNGSRS